jgi:polysaccharide biosynthesis protein PslH
MLSVLLRQYSLSGPREHGQLGVWRQRDSLKVMGDLYHHKGQPGSYLSCDENTRLRVLFITEFLPWPLTSGGRIRTFHILQQLALRHHVTLITQKAAQDSEGEERLRSMVSQLYAVDLKPRSSIKKTLGVAASVVVNEPYVGAYGHYRKPLARMIKKIAQQQRFDIVHLDHLDAAVYLPDCAPNSAVYLDQHNHETSLLKSTRDNTSKFFLCWYLSSQLPKLARFEKKILNSVDGIGVVSTEDGRIMSAVAPHAAVEIIPNGVDLAFFDVPRQPIPFRILTVGSLDWLPNIEGLIWFLDHVWPRVLENRPQTILEVVGRNPAQTLLKRRDHHVKVIGSVPDVREYLAKASVFVVPLFAGGGTRLKVLEAMSMRTPIVSTHIGIEGIDCMDGKHVLVATDPEDFAYKVVKLLDEPALAVPLLTASRALVEQHYGWNAIGERLDAFYRRIASEQCL